MAKNKLLWGPGQHSHMISDERCWHSSQKAPSINNNFSSIGAVSIISAQIKQRPRCSWHKHLKMGEVGLDKEMHHARQRNWSRKFQSDPRGEKTGRFCKSGPRTHTCRPAPRVSWTLSSHSFHSTKSPIRVGGLFAYSTRRDANGLCDLNPQTDFLSR